MTGFNRKQCIDTFIRWLRQPFVNVFPVSKGRADLIAAEHFSAVRAITDDMVQEVVRIMQNSITAHADHYRIREWKRCCRGVADYILRPGDIDGVHRLVAAGVLVRLSGYIHHCPAFFADFRPAATQMDDVMHLHLPYLKTGGDITIDTDCVDKEGYITLWNFAKGSKHEVRRSESEIRTLASRILNFICLYHFHNARITRPHYTQIEQSFDRNEHTLYRWSVSDKWVDLIARRLQVPADDLLAFLYPPEHLDDEDNDEDIDEDIDAAIEIEESDLGDVDFDDDLAPAFYGSRPTFDSNQMYKPDRERRHQWFRSEWNIV